MRYLLITLTICIGLMLGCNSKNNSKTEFVTSEEIIAEEQNSNSEAQEYIEEANHLEYDPSKTLYFSHAFIYKYTDEDESKEFWLYHNPENGQLLYVPEDEMIDFVISDPDGNYYFFGNDGHGNDMVDAQFVEWVANPEFYDENETYPISDQYVKLIPTGKKKVLNEYSKIDGKEIISEEYSYTYITVTKLQEIYPEYEFYFIMGADSLDYFDKWRKPEVIASVCKILVINRDEFSETDMEEKISRINTIFPADIQIVHCPKVDVSSTELRAKLDKSDLLPSVYDYICSHDLYGN